MEERVSWADIKAHMDEQRNRRLEQRANEPGGRAIAAARAKRNSPDAANPYAERTMQLYMSPLAHHGLVVMGVQANYIASADTMRAHGISEFVRDLVDPKGPAGRVEFADTRPIELRDPDYLPGYAHPDLLGYKFWWTPRLDRESDVEHWRTMRVFKFSDATISRLILIALDHEIAAPDRIHATWQSIADYCETHRSETAITVHRHPLALSQAAAVLEVIGLGYLTPSCLPHSNKHRRFRRKQLTDLDFF